MVRQKEKKVSQGAARVLDNERLWASVRTLKGWGQSLGSGFRV